MGGDLRESVDDAWLAKKPKWKRFHHHPVSFAMVWRKQA